MQVRSHLIQALRAEFVGACELCAPLGLGGRKLPGLDLLDEALTYCVVVEAFLDRGRDDVAAGADDEIHDDAAGELGVTGEAFVVASPNLVEVAPDDLPDDVLVDSRFPS